MKNRQTSQDKTKKKHHNIPDLDIIDLEKDVPLESVNPSSDEYQQEENNYEPEKGSNRKKSGNFFSRINMHLVLLAVALIFVACLVYKVMNWGEFIDLDEIFADGPGTYEDTYDEIIPLINADGEPVHLNYDDDISVLVFGNAPFADDRDSKDSLENIIQEMSNVTIYNCSIRDSYLAAIEPTINTDICPIDAFNFYWMCTLATTDVIDDKYLYGVGKLGTDAPPEAMEVYNTLKSIDLNTIDVIAVMYDASDYLAGHGIYNNQNSTDIMQFTGNLEAGIELFQNQYPNIRIIVMSPTYAYGLDENGKYVSSDIQRYGQDVLSMYSIMQYVSCASRSVTFVDNLYGTITEDNADDYLTDHLHLNVEGRKKVAERFLYALYYFRDSD